MITSPLSVDRHRDAEHLKEELEMLHSILRLSVDALELSAIAELDHVKFILDHASERAYTNIATAEKLMNTLFSEYTQAEKWAKRQGDAA
jgi:hypothetical protein